MTPEWKVGLVGMGRGSGYGRLFANEPRCEVVACCDANESALAVFQRELGLSDSHCFTDYEQMLAVGLDIVVLGTPIPFHAQQTMSAVKAGANVLSEVTAASTVEDCGRIVDAVRRTGKTYMLAENCCFWPFVAEWRDMVRAGRLGEIIYSECEYLHPIPQLIVDLNTGEPRWRAQRAPLHYCTHSLGPILEITGDRITRAMGLGNGHRVMPEYPIVGMIDIQVALFQTERNAIIKLLRTSVAPHHFMHSYTLQGTRGFVETDRKGPSKGLLCVEGEMDGPQEFDVKLVDESLPPEARAGGHGTAEYGVVQEFLRALETGTKPSLDEVRAMDLTVPGLIAHESAMQGAVWMEVPTFA